MFRLSHIAAPAIVSAAMFAGLQGCATADRPDSVPAHAMVISEGKETVATAAPHNGMIYITDSTDNKLVYSSKVNQGDSVEIDAKRDKILMNDKVASDTGLSDADHYKIYFEGEKLSDAQLSSQRETPMTPATPAPTHDNNYNSNYNSTPGYNNTSPANGATGSQPVPNGNGASITQPNGTDVKQGDNGTSTGTAPPAH